MTGSGDIIADRRFAWVQALLREGDHAAAADLLEQVVERVPGWPPGWAALGEVRDRLGDRRGAHAAWARVAALDPEGKLGAALHLARLDGTGPDAMPDAYVAALFDDYAPRFDRHLREGLGYRGPEVILAALDRAAPGRRFARTLDLGCGTGLMGLALAGRTDAVDGVDLSAAMVERARATGAYADLQVASIADRLAGVEPGRYDLVTAADALVYVGDLSGLFAGAARALTRSGLLAFTVETSAAESNRVRGVALGPDLRFAHTPGYVEAELAHAGFVDARLRAASTRTERCAPVPGIVATATIA